MSSSEVKDLVEPGLEYFLLNTSNNSLESLQNVLSARILPSESSDAYSPSSFSSPQQQNMDQHSQANYHSHNHPHNSSSSENHSDASSLSSEDLAFSNTMLERMDEDMKFSEQFIHLSSPDTEENGGLLFPDLSAYGFPSSSSSTTITNQAASNIISNTNQPLSNNNNNTNNSTYNELTSITIQNSSPSTMMDSHNPSSSSHHNNNNNNHNHHHHHHNNSNHHPEVEVILLHKPRGCKGVWKQVERHNALRVTKGKGKWLKLEVRSPHCIHTKDVDIFLVDVSNHPSQEDVIKNRLVHTESEGLSIESTSDSEMNPQDGNFVVKAEIKLDRVCKKLQFWVAVKLSDKVLVGRSVEFSAHNNGKTRLESPQEGASPSSSDESSSPIHIAEMPAFGSIADKVESPNHPHHHQEHSKNIHQTNNNNHHHHNNSNRALKAPKAEKKTKRASPPPIHPTSTTTTTTTATTSQYQGGLPPKTEMYPMPDPLYSSPSTTANSNASSSNILNNQQQQGLPQYQPPIDMNNVLPYISSHISPQVEQFLQQQQQQLLLQRQFQEQQQQFLRNSNNSPTSPILPSLQNPNTNPTTIPDQEMRDAHDPKKRKRNLTTSPPNDPQIYSNNNTTTTMMNNNNNTNNNSNTMMNMNMNNNNYPSTTVIPEIPAEDVVEMTVLNNSLQVNGFVKAQAFVQFSDLRLKTDIQELTDAVNIVSQLEGRSYTWKRDLLTGETGGRRVIGLIAQQVQQVLPEVVHEDKETGLLSVSYAEIVPILIEAFKQHIQFNEAQHETIHSHIQDLRNRLEQLYKDDPNKSSSFEASRPALFAGRGKMNTFYKKTSPYVPKRVFHIGTCRTFTVILFLLGLFLLVFGSIKLGILIYSSDRNITVNVVECRGLNFTNADTPDPYVQVAIGYEVFRTETVWNSLTPVFEDTFKAPLDYSFNKVVFQVFDDEADPNKAARRMGIVTYMVDGLKPGHLYENWLTISANEAGGVAGELHVIIEVKTKKSPGYEIAFIVIGTLLLLLSLVFGTSVWRSAASAYRRRPFAKPLPSNGV